MPPENQAERQCGISGTRVRAIRKLRRLSQKQLAKMVDRSNIQISIVEKDQSQTSLRTTMAIAEALETSMDYLVGWVDDTRPSRALASELKMKSPASATSKKATRSPSTPNGTNTSASKRSTQRPAPAPAPTTDQSRES